MAGSARTQAGGCQRWLASAVAVCAGVWSGAVTVQGAAVAPGRSDSPYLVDVWQDDDGLPSNTITSITEARDGYLWFGTISGLVRFDGVRFVILDANSNPSLGSGRVVHLFEDRDGGLWAGTDAGGVARIRDGQVTTYAMGLGISSQRLASACQDATGAVWLYGRDGQVWRYREDRFAVFSIGMGRSSGSRCIVAEGSGQVWVGADWVLGSIPGTAAPGPLEEQLVQEMPIAKLDLLVPSRSGGFWRLADRRVRKYVNGRLDRDSGAYPWGGFPVSAGTEDNQGKLVVGTLGGGVFWQDENGAFRHITIKEGLSQDIILALAVDREGSLWIGTDDGGLNRVRPRAFQTLDKRHGLPTYAIMSVCEDQDGGLWVASNGGGVARIKDGKTEHYGSANGLTNLHVWSVLVDHQQRVWAGTWGSGVFRMSDGRFEAVGPPGLDPVVLALHEDRLGAVWLGTQGGLACHKNKEWKVFTMRDGLSASEVRAIADDADGNLWIGTVGGGLNRLKNGQFQAYRRQSGLPTDDISSLYADSDGTLWIGTRGGGLAIHRDGKFTRVGMREGFPANNLGTILEDGQGNLWIASNAGLIRAQKKDLDELRRGPQSTVHCRSFGKPDGLPARECIVEAQPGGWRGRDGSMWFPTVRGLVSVQPGQILPNPNPPRVIIESVAIDGQALNTNSIYFVAPNPLVLPPGKEQLEIRFTSLSLSAPDRGAFRYRMEGHETAWVEAGASRSARYGRLPPGKYRFQLAASNEDGVWSQAEPLLAVVVEPPLWRRPWFLGGAALSLATLLGAVVYTVSTQRLQRQLQQLRQKEAVEKERARIARDMHDQVGATLTQITLLAELAGSDKGDPAQVEACSQQITQTSRQAARALDEIVWAANPSNDTLEGLANYICKYAQDYLAVTDTRCRFDLPANLPPLMVPPDVRHNVFLAFKESITNVVRHAQASAVWIRLRLEPGFFTLEIEDNGRGIAGQDPAAASTRNGLRNMRKRLEDVGGQFAIQAAPERGALVRLTVPTDRH